MSDTNEKFVKRMRDTMEVSRHKYGPIKTAYPHKVNAIKSLKKRLALYEETGNADFLVDVANFAMIEFTLPAHENFRDQARDGGTGRVWHSGGAATEKANDGSRQDKLESRGE